MSRLPPIPPSGKGDDTLRDYMIEEFVEEYQEGHMSRREVLKRLGGLLGSAALASTFLAACAPAPTPTTVPPTATTAPPTPMPTSPAVAPTVPSTPATANVAENDPSIDAMAVQFPHQNATLLGYLAKPKGTGPFPIVLVCHENRGLLEHIKDVTRRYGKAGFAALAVDLLSRRGGTDKVEPAQVPGALGSSSNAQVVGDFAAGLAFVQSQPYTRRDRAGMLGFCYGGGVTWLCATQIAELRAAVPYYGPNPPLADIPKIQAAVLAIYGENDARINAGITAIESAMKEANKTFEKIIYPNANHAFFNDTGANYNAAAARDAFAKTLAWLEKYLRA